MTSPVIKLLDYAQVGAVLPKLPQHVTSHHVAIAFALASDWSMTSRKYLKHIKTKQRKATINASPDKPGFSFEYSSIVLQVVWGFY